MTEVIEAHVIESEEALAVSYTPSVIVANFDALEAYVRKVVADYEGAKYDMTNSQVIREAKHDRTYLNGLKKQIDERRKAVKREYTKPLDEFEKRCRQITGIIDEAADNIKAQLDEAEQARRDAAYASLAEHYEEFAALLAPVVPYERIHEEQWTNKTFGEIKAMNALEAKVQKLADAWEILKTQFADTPYYAAAERELFRTLDLETALNAARMAEKEDARIAEMKAAMEPAEEPAEPEPTPAPCPMPEPQPAPCPLPDSPATPCVMVIDSATTEQMRQIGKFCGSLGVTGFFRRGTLQQISEQLAMEAAYDRR